jgi:hypothetical protein
MFAEKVNRWQLDGRRAVGALVGLEQHGAAAQLGDLGAHGGRLLAQLGRSSRIVASSRLRSRHSSHHVAIRCSFRVSEIRHRENCWRAVLRFDCAESGVFVAGECLDDGQWWQKIMLFDMTDYFAQLLVTFYNNGTSKQW